MPKKILHFGAFLIALVQYRVVVYPAVGVFVTAGVHLIGWSTSVEKNVLAFVDASFGLLAAGVTVWGLMADQKNRETSQKIELTSQQVHTIDIQTSHKIESAAQQTSAALTDVAEKVNILNPLVDTPEVTAPPIQTPIEIKPHNGVIGPEEKKV